VRIDRAPGFQAQAAAPVVIVAVPAFDSVSQRLPAHFDALVDDQAIVTSTRQPFFDGCRALLALGYDPGQVAVMRHAGSPVDCLYGAIGAAAALTVKEPDADAIRLATWKAFSDRPVEPPVAFAGLGAVGVGVGAGSDLREEIRI
jgi:hypothetical protein